jgi:hypothetical protein
VQKKIEVVVYVYKILVGRFRVGKCMRLLRPVDLFYKC